jgi:diguanylate cyclase (GGDEF)-like protein
MDITSSVLLIDRNPVTRRSISQLLHAHGYLVQEAGTAAEGLQQALAYQPHLILLDIDLPDNTGVEFCRQLKTMPELVDTFIGLVATPETDPACPAEALANGADDYCIRPITNQEFLARVETMVRIRNAEATARLKVQQQSVLADLGQLAMSGASTEELFSAAVTMTAQVLQAEQCHILHLLPDRHTLVVAAGSGWSEGLLGETILIDDELAAKMATLDVTPPLVLENVALGALADMPELLLAEVADCLYTVIRGEHDPYGLLGVHDPRSGEFTFDDARYLQSVTHILSLAMMRQQVGEAVQFVTMHDDLTGLYNRSYYLEEFQRLRRGRHFPISLVLLDIESLKTINSIYGLAIGDNILKYVGQVLRSTFRAEDVIARIGDDDFAVLLPHAGATIAKLKCIQVRETLARHPLVLPDALPITVSMGFASANDADALELMHHAAEAMMRQEKHTQL